MTRHGFDRRRFIQACAGAGLASAAAASGMGLFTSLEDTDVDIVPISYHGLQVLPDSPAPYGLPLIPLEITDDGALRGVPDAFPDQLKWYRYCGNERTPGAHPVWDGDDLIRYHVIEAQRADGPDAWYGDHLDEIARWQHLPQHTADPLFQDYPGTGAPFRWRSGGMPPEATLTGILLRIPQDELGFTASVPRPIQEDLQAWMPQHPEDGESLLVACASMCTHYCCKARFHSDRIAEQRGAGDTIFCTCHFSRYDPFTIDRYDRTIFEHPRHELEAAFEEHGIETP